MVVKIKDMIFYKCPVLLSVKAYMLYDILQVLCGWVVLECLFRCFDSCPLPGPAGPHQWYDHPHSLYHLTVQAQHELYSVL